MKQLEAKIIENKSLARGFYKMRLGSAYLAKNSKPGQFVEIKCSEGGEVLLRRPLGVHRILNGGIEVLYKVIGKGTELLSRKRPGDTVDVIGPLGNGFSIKRNTNDKRRTTVLVAGGIGVAPLVALAESLVHSSKLIVHSKRKKIYVLIGACKKGHVLCVNDFKKLGAEVIVYTEDGFLGKKGLVTDGLNSLLSTINYELSTIYACGPAAMLKTIAKIAEAKRVPCQVSMEERMACGVGVCLGCPIKVHTTSTQYAIPRTTHFVRARGRRNTQYAYKMACKDGPVFNAKEIVW
ncbi:MAG: dihydroorotate dehydrogenase electron transfer subunit [Candidatus Omnitrophica bacterium]|nr:dihydroorotate dehydrogenase electron transfer subunit [Candidatus Omnitrophota bacterium]